MALRSSRGRPIDAPAGTPCDRPENYLHFFALPSRACEMKKRKDSTTEITIAFVTIALVAAVLIVYFDTAHKLKLLDDRIENIEMSGPQTK
jgi:hypothetical protein